MPGQPSWLTLLREAATRRGWRDVGWSFGGTALQVVIGLATTTILARTLGPANFGVLNVALALVFIVSGLSDAGSSAALIRLGSPEVMSGRGVGSLHWAFLSLRLLLALALGVLLVAAGRWLVPSLQLPAGLAWLALASAAAGIALTSGAHYTTILQVIREQRLISLLRGAAGLIRLGVLAVLAAVGALRLVPALGVAYGAVLLETGMYAIGAHRTASLGPPRLRLPERDWLRFFGWASAPAIAYATIGQTDTLLLAALGGQVETGLWNAAARVASVITMGAGAVWAVTFPYVSGIVHREQLDRYLRGALRAMLLVALVLPVAWLAAPALNSLFFGAAYARASEVLRWLLVANSLGACAMLLLPIAYYFRRERLVALLAGLMFLVNLGGDVVLIPRFGAVGCAAATCVMHGLNLAVLFRAAWGKSPADAGQPEVPFVDRGEAP